MGFWQNIFGKNKNKVKYLDLRSKEEKKIEKEAYTGKKLESNVESLLAELIAIGQTDDFISTTQKTGKFNNNGDNIRAREIGNILNDMGNIKLMQKVAYRVNAKLGPALAKHLSYCWDHIDGWLT